MELDVFHKFSIFCKEISVWIASANKVYFGVCKVLRCKAVFLTSRKKSLVCDSSGL